MKREKKTKTHINLKPKLPEVKVNETSPAVANSIVETLKNVPKTYKAKTSITEALKKKSKKSGISMKIVFEVFKRGALAWDSGDSGDKVQAGFSRLNSYIAGGIARNIDADLTEKINNPEKEKELTREAKVIQKVRGIILP